MNKTHLLSGIFIVLIVLVLVTVLLKNKEAALAPASPLVVNNTPSVTPSATPMPSPAETGTPVPKITVRYTSTGFSPATFTVNKGETVRFINETTGRMSVASDPHPTHTIYPEFDQYKTSARGQSTFDFTFEKIGTWGYHNHAQASHTGTVIVQ